MKTRPINWRGALLIAMGLTIIALAQQQPPQLPSSSRLRIVNPQRPPPLPPSNVPNPGPVYIYFQQHPDTKWGWTLVEGNEIIAMSPGADYADQPAAFANYDRAAKAIRSGQPVGIPSKIEPLPPAPQP